MHTPVLHTSYPAVPSSVAVARDLVAAVAERGGASPERVESVRLAVSEVLTNAVQQPDRGGAGEVHVRATIVRGELLVAVADDASDTRRMGFGLRLIAACSDHFTVGTTPAGGVHVQMSFVLEAADRASSREAALASAL
jgi:histidine kinase-like protein